MPPQPPRRVQHVEVRQRAHHLRHALHLAAQFHHRHVERATVVRHQHGIVAEVGVERVQQGALGGKGRQQELRGAEPVRCPLAHARQEGHHAGTAAQAGRLEVEVHEPRRREGQRIAGRGAAQASSREQVECVVETDGPALVHAHTSMTAIGFEQVIDDDARSVRGGLEACSREPESGSVRARDPWIDGQTVVVHRLVGQLAKAGLAGLAWLVLPPGADVVLAGPDPRAISRRRDSDDEATARRAPRRPVRWRRHCSRASRSRATRLARGPMSPTGPTHEGQPISHGQLAISCCVCASSGVVHAEQRRAEADAAGIVVVEVHVRVGVAGRGPAGSLGGGGASDARPRRPRRCRCRSRRRGRAGRTSAATARWRASRAQVHSRRHAGRRAHTARRAARRAAR